MTERIAMVGAGYFAQFQLFQMFVKDPDGLTIETRDLGGAGLWAGLTRRIGGHWRPDVDYTVRIPRAACAGGGDVEVAVAVE